jgi:hypothetical protein
LDAKTLNQIKEIMTKKEFAGAGKKLMISQKVI